MTIEDLTEKENELYFKVRSLNGTIEEKYCQIVTLGISEEYKVIHQNYSELSAENIEALKRGIFLNWFAVSEPTFLTGIEELNENAQENIVKEINERLKNGTVDSELNWMLDYYKSWDYAFTKFEKYHLFNAKIMSKKETELPNIEKKEMESRGQMGIYWSSLNQ